MFPIIEILIIEKFYCEYTTTITLFVFSIHFIKYTIVFNKTIKNISIHFSRFKLKVYISNNIYYRLSKQQQKNMTNKLLLLTL